MQRMPFVRIKNDRNFVANLVSDAQSVSIICAILAIGKELDLSGTAAGGARMPASRPQAHGMFRTSGLSPQLTSAFKRKCVGVLTELKQKVPVAFTLQTESSTFGGKGRFSLTQAAENTQFSSSMFKHKSTKFVFFIIRPLAGEGLIDSEEKPVAGQLVGACLHGRRGEIAHSRAQ